LLEQEELGEADQRLMVMPAEPAAHLVGPCPVRFWRPGSRVRSSNTIY
jgi:hypothetical protein